MNDIIISLPIYVELGVKKKTTFSLNLNTYRNAHHHILNNAKIKFGEMVEALVRQLPAMAKVELTYRLFFGTRRKVDVANVCCIVDKFFSDTLVNCGRLPGDDNQIISDVHYGWGGLDPENPRVEVTLSNIELSAEVQEQDPSMQISFTQSEITQALEEFLEKQISLRPGQSVSIEFDLQNPKDIIAVLDIAYAGEGSLAAITKAAASLNNGLAAGDAEKPTRRTRGPNKPKVEDAPLKPPSGAEIEVPIPDPNAVTEAQVEAASEAAAEDETVEDQASEASDNPANVPAETPFKPPFANPAEIAKSVDKIIADKAAAPAEAAPAPSVASSIFPNAGNSAPVTPAVVQPAASPKSLFANLQRPTNAPTTH